MASQRAPEVCPSPLPMHWECRDANTLDDFFMWVQGLLLVWQEVHSSAISPAPTFHILTSDNTRLNFWKRQGGHWASATLRTELPQPSVLTGHVPNPLWVCSSRKKMQGMEWKYFGTLSCSGSIFCISLTLQISQCLPTPVVLNTAIQTK